MRLLPERAKVLIVEDDSLLSESLTELLDFQPDLKVIAGVSTLSEAQQVLATQTVDVILFDYDLGNEFALAFLARTAELNPSPSVLVLAREISFLCIDCLEAKGAKGIFLKATGFRDLIKAIRQLVMQPAGPFCVKYRTMPGVTSRRLFTKRQLDVASAVLMGQATKEIAGSLGVSDGAVKSTMQQLFAKTQTRSRPQLVRALLEQDLLRAGGGSPKPAGSFLVDVTSRTA